MSRPHHVVGIREINNCPNPPNDLPGDIRYTEEMGIVHLHEVTPEQHKKECMEQSVREIIWEIVGVQNDAYQLKDNQDFAIATTLSEKFHILISWADVWDQPISKIIKKTVQKIISQKKATAVLEN